MTLSQLHVQEFMDLFKGSKNSFGVWEQGKATKDNENGGKLGGNYQHCTDRLITFEHYKNHLEGKKSLGIVPIRDDGKCSFAVIDVDIYDQSLNAYIEAIDRARFPIVPFYTKSGGLHLYTFFLEPVNANKAIELMRKYSFLLSIDILYKNKDKGRVEVFPKQTKLEPGEKGSFINLPYFDANKTPRFATKQGNKLNLSDALIHIKSKRVTYDYALNQIDIAEFHDAPPCLQLPYYLNPFGNNSNRNSFLFSFGVYLKKKNEDFFDQNLLEVNSKLRSPLPDKEVIGTIVKSLSRKDYSYKCNESPCIDFCSKQVCKQREYGIGRDEGYFSSIELGQMYQYQIDQPYYEWDVRKQGSDSWVRLYFKSEDEIMRQDTFLKLCMRTLHELPNKLKQMSWTEKINQCLREIKLVDISEEYDTSPFVILKNYIVEFLRGRVMAQSTDQIKAGRVYYNFDNEEYYFRLMDLVEFLNNKKIYIFEFREIYPLTVKMGAKKKRVNYRDHKGYRKQMRVSMFLKGDIDKMQEEYEINPDFSDFKDEDF